jgi:hypothetical protein
MALLNRILRAIVLPTSLATTIIGWVHNRFCSIGVAIDAETSARSIEIAAKFPGGLMLMVCVTPVWQTKSDKIDESEVAQMFATGRESFCIAGANFWCFRKTETGQRSV